MRPLRLAPALLLLAGCATLGPRFDQDVATTFAQDEMRRLETPELELYYPAQHREAALRVAGRAAECLRALRTLDATQRDRGRALLFLTTSNYNNAYVTGMALGEPLHSLNPLSATWEFFHWYGLGGADVGDIACHEMFHYAHFEQVEGAWRWLNAVVGPVVPSQAFLERWFTEGVAQYYEGRLGRSVGRPHSPLYRGAFDSFVALRGGHVGAGDLSLYNRELSPFSGAYLTSLHFVEWLVERHGEDKLWQVMEVQGRSVFSPFGATLRFKAVYGLSVGALLDAWEEALVKGLVVRQRPASQRVVRPGLGQMARLAAHAPSGTLALVTSGNEEVPMLRILEADGRVRVERRLVRLGTDREWVLAGPSTMSGLGFTADGKWLFLLNDDLVERGDTRAQVWRIDAATGEVDRVWQDVGRGMGGDVSPDGTAYAFVDFDAGRSRLVERDLASGATRVLAEFPPGVSVGAPRWDPGHGRLVFSRFDPAGWNLVVREADGTLRDLTSDGAFNYGARWSDAAHVVFARKAGRYLQVHRLEVDSGRLERLSDAPWGVMDPAPAGDSVALVNRDGTGWSLDTVPLDSLETTTLAPAGPAPAWHEPRALEVQRDEPASSLEGLFVPQLRAPGIVGGITADETGRLLPLATLSLSLAGSDRLGKHRWIFNGALTVPTWDHSVQLGYLNYALAPWAFSVAGSRNATATQASWSGNASASRSFFTVPVYLGLQAEVSQPFDGTVQKYLGPSLSIAYSAGDGTGYGGTQRAFSMGLDAAGYAHALGSDRDLLDLRVTVGLALPPPLLKRHSFTVGLAGRFLPGAPENALLVGGTGRLTSLYESHRSPFPEGPGQLLPGSMVEYLRGYEDTGVRVQNAGLVHARYRTSVIVDRGTASTLYLFPSFFFRQVDFEAFPSAALTDHRTTPWMRAEGAAVSLRTAWGGSVPVTLSYQFAWRFDLGLPPLHLVGFGLE